MATAHINRIAVVGAGLSGLVAAFLLEQLGITDYVLLEARDRLGGRIASGSASAQLTLQTTTGALASHRIDLGPTWFWPTFQPQLASLVDELGLATFTQFETGDTVIERASHQPPQRVAGYANSPASMRLLGGMQSLVDELRRRINGAHLYTDQAVRSLRCTHQHVELESANAEAQTRTWRADHVLLALPPRLVESALIFTPALPAALTAQWRATPTWMAPQAKYVAVYDTPFWRAQGLSGAARSSLGPMGEIHDASPPSGGGALFGFLGVPAHVRQSLPPAELRAHCRAQLVRIFGRQANKPCDEFLKDWAFDPFTATAADLDAGGQHAQAPASIAASGPWMDRITGIASEWSPQFPGYLAGALEAATLGVKALQASLAR